MILFKRLDSQAASGISAQDASRILEQMREVSAKLDSNLQRFFAVAEPVATPQSSACALTQIDAGKPLRELQGISVRAGLEKRLAQALEKALEEGKQYNCHDLIPILRLIITEEESCYLGIDFQTPKAFNSLFGKMLGRICNDHTNRFYKKVKSNRSYYFLYDGGCGQ